MDTNSPLVAAISGKIGAVFPTLGTANGQQPQFYGTFKQAANLTSIPGDFFDGVYGSRYSLTTKFARSVITKNRHKGGFVYIKILVFKLAISYII